MLKSLVSRETRARRSVFILKLSLTLKSTSELQMFTLVKMF